MPNIHTLRKVSILIIVLFSLVSCRQSETVSIIPDKNPPTESNNFGFNLNDFNVFHDTIRRGDTFGSIIENQNLGDKQVYDIIEKVKDSFNLKTIKIGKSFTLLRTKDRHKKLEVFVYQPDRASYYVIDFRDSIHAYKKAKPITFKTRIIAGALDGSLPETLKNLKVDPSFASKIAKVFSWSIDFFKLKKGDTFGLKFTERYVNDTIYDGIDSLKAAFFEYKGEKIYVHVGGKEGLPTHVGLGVLLHMGDSIRINIRVLPSV